MTTKGRGVALKKAANKNEAQLRKKSNTGNNIKHKKVSNSTVSRWKTVPPQLQEHVMSILEESISTFIGSENDVVDSTLERIRSCVDRMLRKVKVPQEKWADVKSLKTVQKNLLDEQTRLEELEMLLISNLDNESRHLRSLESELARLKGRSRSSTTGDVEQIHPILMRVQETL